MNTLNRHFLNHPITSVTVLIAVSLILVLGVPYPFVDAPDVALVLKITTRLLVSGMAFCLLMKLGWLESAGILGRPWRKRWWLAPLPMLAIVAINILNVNWDALVFTPGATAGWLGYNMSVGLFEEILLRGVCFCLLLKAWEGKPNGLMAAAVTQGAIFGLLHLINLSHAPVLDTVSQTVYATLLGIGFAGMTIYCRSIWPAVMVHAAINLAGSMNIDLVPGATESAGSLPGYIVAMVVIFLVSTLPGLVQLRREQRALSTA